MPSTGDIQSTALAALPEAMQCHHFADFWVALGKLAQMRGRLRCKLPLMNPAQVFALLRRMRNCRLSCSAAWNSLPRFCSPNEPKSNAETHFAGHRGVDRSGSWRVRGKSLAAEMPVVIRGGLRPDCGSLLSAITPAGAPVNTAYSPQTTILPGADA